MDLNRPHASLGSRLLIVAAPIAVSAMAKSTAPWTTPFGLCSAGVTSSAAVPSPRSVDATTMPRWSWRGNHGRLERHRETVTGNHPSAW